MTFISCLINSAFVFWFSEIVCCMQITCHAVDNFTIQFRHVLQIFIALFTVVGSAIACPDRCSCNTTTTTVECVAGNLTVVPPGTYYNVVLRNRSLSPNILINFLFERWAQMGSGLVWYERWPRNFHLSDYVFWRKSLFLAKVFFGENVFWRKSTPDKFPARFDNVHIPSFNSYLLAASGIHPPEAH